MEQLKLKIIQVFTKVAEQKGFVCPNTVHNGGITKLFQELFNVVINLSA